MLLVKTAGIYNQKWPMVDKYETYTCNTEGATKRSCKGVQVKKTYREGIGY